MMRTIGVLCVVALATAGPLDNTPIDQNGTTGTHRQLSLNSRLYGESTLVN
jgi:hypothetical protein